MTRSRLLVQLTAACGVVIALAIVGCPSTPTGGNGDGGSDGDGDGNGDQQASHVDVALKDRMGNVILAGSSEPYSPRQTCGTCHDIDHIANGYHFQQGRTDLAGEVITKSDFFDDGREWLRSAGMYGKW